MKEPLIDNLNKSISTIDGSKHNNKTRLERTQSVLSLVSTSLAIIGTLGSISVWLLATFYTGNIEIVQNKIFESKKLSADKLNSNAAIDVNKSENFTLTVYNKDGHEAIYHTKKIVLMPGEYHLKVVSDFGDIQHFDTNVYFNQTTKLILGSNKFETENIKVPKKKHWWQFWRSKNDDTNSLGIERNK